MKFENTKVFNIEGALRGMRNPLDSWNKSDSVFGVCAFEPADDSYEMAEAYYGDCSWKKTDDLEKIKKAEDRIDEIQQWLFDQGVRYDKNGECAICNFIGPEDMNLAKRLILAGPEHRKFLRQIFVSVDITAPLYWWKEFDTYKVGTVANSCSTMHKLASYPITIDNFELGDYDPKLIVETGIDDRGDNPWEYEILIEDIIGTNEKKFYYAETFIGFLESLRKKYLETKDKRYWKELVRWLPEGWLQKRTITMNYENLRSMLSQRSGHKLTEWKSFCEWARSLPYAEDLISYGLNRD